MADSDKNIIITPNRGATSQPSIAFTGQGNDPITLRVLDGTTGAGLTAGGALSFEGSAGQLFSVVNRLGTGSIFSVNDISGMPSIDVDANGTIELAPFTGYVAIGLTAPTEKLHVTGNIRSSGSVNAFGGVSAAGGTFASDIVVNGVRVGEGGGSIVSNVAVGQSALNNNTTGNQNVAIGTETSFTGKTAYNITAVGYRALYLNDAGIENTAVGSLVLDANTSGIQNVGVGVRSLTTNTTGSYNVGVGVNSLTSNSTGNNNCAVGQNAMILNSSGISNIAIGANASYSNSSGSSNVSVGNAAGYSGVTASSVVAIGGSALFYNMKSENTAVGASALIGNCQGDRNVAVGAAAAASSQTASDITAIGHRALYLNTESSNTALGSESLDANTTGAQNSAFGYATLTSNTTGALNTGIGYGSLANNILASDNTAIGARALIGLNGNTASSNTAIGSRSLELATTAYDNTAIGYYSGRALTTGNNNILVGNFAANSLTTGRSNVVMGWRAGQNGTGYGGCVFVGDGVAALDTLSGRSNVAVGAGAGRILSSGSNNVLIGGGDMNVEGPGAGSTLSTGSGNVMIGSRANALTGSDTNSIVIAGHAGGDYTRGLGSNTTLIGNTATTITQVYGTLSTNGGVSAAGGTFAGIVNFLGGMCVASGITLTAAAGTRTHLSQGGIRGANFKIRNQVSFGLGSGDANEFDIGPSGGNITIAPTTSTVTIDTGLQNKSSVDYQTGIRFLGYNTMLATSYNTLLQVGFGSGNTLSLPSTSGTLALTNDVVTRFNGLTGQVTGVTTGNANTFGPLQSFTNGISASGGITLSSLVTANRYTTTSSVFETKSAGFTLAAADNGKIFLMDNSATAIIYCPTGLPVGFNCDVIRRAANPTARVRIFESGTTIESIAGPTPELTTSGNGGERAKILQIATNVFNVSGDI